MLSRELVKKLSNWLFANELPIKRSVPPDGRILIIGVVNKRNVPEEKKLLRDLYEKVAQFQLAKDAISLKMYLEKYILFLANKTQFSSNLEKLAILRKIVASKHLEILMVMPSLTDAILADNNKAFSRGLEKIYNNLKSRDSQDFKILELSLDSQIARCIKDDSKFVDEMMKLNKDGYFALQLQKNRGLFCSGKLLAVKANELGNDRDVEVKQEIKSPKIPHVNIHFFDEDWEDQAQRANLKKAQKWSPTLFGSGNSAKAAADTDANLSLTPQNSK